VREEWGVKSAGMVKTYMHIPDACLPWGVPFLDISRGHSRAQGFVGRDLEWISILQRTACGLKLMEFLVFLKNVHWNRKVWLGLPWCLGYQIADPFDQVFIASSMFPVLQNLLHFVHFLSFCVWWWLDIILSIDLIFSIRTEQCGMEDFVDLPRLQEF
jgi:hypothetical protein